MIRVLLTQLLLFLLPFIMYAGYLFLNQRLHKRAWIDAPRYWLVLSGLALSLIGFFVMSQINNNPLGGTYIPARYENGEVIPGHIKGAE